MIQTDRYDPMRFPNIAYINKKVFFERGSNCMTKTEKLTKSEHRDQVKIL